MKAILKNDLRALLDLKDCACETFKNPPVRHVTYRVVCLPDWALVTSLFLFTGILNSNSIRTSGSPLITVLATEEVTLLKYRLLFYCQYPPLIFVISETNKIMH